MASLERLQKTVLQIILGDEYKSYTTALKSLGLNNYQTEEEHFEANLRGKLQSMTNSLSGLNQT